MARVEDMTLWRVTGMNRLIGPERELREMLAHDYLGRLRSQVSVMPVQPRLESLAWAVDELNAFAECVDSPETPQARSEMESALAEVVSKLQQAARAGR